VSRRAHTGKRTAPRPRMWAYRAGVVRSVRRGRNAVVRTPLLSVALPDLGLSDPRCFSEGDDGVPAWSWRIDEVLDIGSFQYFPETKKALHLCKALILLVFLAPRPGLEPGTYGLTDRRELGLNQRLRCYFRSAICHRIRESEPGRFEIAEQICRHLMGAARCQCDARAQALRGEGSLIEAIGERIACAANRRHAVNASMAQCPRRKQRISRTHEADHQRGLDCSVWPR
jgi:hypothetical protein